MYFFKNIIFLFLLLFPISSFSMQHDSDYECYDSELGRTVWHDGRQDSNMEDDSCESTQPDDEDEMGNLFN
ncbi:hypothetical protein K9M16_00015 [Candidatus Babeliales bacterium]|nr:hypothetical protein [Candidatus Babeliales bacterium]